MNFYDKLSRKNFLKLLGVAGLGSLFNINACKNPDDETKNSGKIIKVPKRKLGKTGLEVPCISHGIMYNLLERQIVLHYGLKWGINFFDTANFYAGGNSELGLGKFIKDNPDRRKDMIIMTKESRQTTIDGVEKCLQTSLKRMNTSYVDIYCGIQALSDPSRLTDDLRKFSEKAKKKGQIKHFGFSTHNNMAKCLKAAAKLDWIDVIFTVYNFRLINDPEMQDAIEECHQAGKGIVAMKAMALQVRSDKEKELVKRFMKGDLTEHQAKIKAVLSDKRIHSLNITMGSTALITANASAAIGTSGLSHNDIKHLIKYAAKTKNCYCTGCSDICANALSNDTPVNDIMRYLMYYNSYGDKKLARQLYSEMPGEIKNSLSTIDFSPVEKICPQGLPIGSLINEAVVKLS